MSSIGGRSGSFVAPGGLVELGYSQITSNVTINNATAGTGTEVIAPLTVVCDGSPILVEFFSPHVRPYNDIDNEINISLFEDSSEAIRSWGRFYNGAGGFDNKPAYLSVRLTPSAGSHTYGVKAYVTNAANTGQVSAGAYSSGGTSTTSAPCYLRVSKIVEQGTALKPFWTPPIVTELPTNATLGDMVTLASANGNHRPAQYDGTDWQIMGVGSKPPSCLLSISSLAINSQVDLGNTTTSGTWTEVVDTDTMHDAVTNPTRITVKTAGIYMVTASLLGGTGNISSYAMIKVNGTQFAQSTFPANAAYFTRGQATLIYNAAEGTYFEFQTAASSSLTCDFRFSATYLGQA